MAAAKRTRALEERKNGTVTAKQLQAAYQQNEVKADQNFKGKKFYVEGVVESIGKDILDNPYVTLKTDPMFQYVQCVVDDENVAASLNKGVKVTFLGECRGSVITNVLMEDCVLVENKENL